VVYPVLEFREKKQTFTKSEGGNVDFFSSGMQEGSVDPCSKHAQIWESPFHMRLHVQARESISLLRQHPSTINARRRFSNDQFFFLSEQALRTCDSHVNASNSRDRKKSDQKEVNERFFYDCSGWAHLI
jgi:hypothetical protein